MLLLFERKNFGRLLFFTRFDNGGVLDEELALLNGRKFEIDSLSGTLVTLDSSTTTVAVAVLWADLGDDWDESDSSDCAVGDDDDDEFEIEFEPAGTVDDD